MVKKSFTDKMIEQIFEQSGLIAYVDEAGKYQYVNNIWEKDRYFKKKCLGQISRRTHSWFCSDVGIEDGQDYFR